MSAETITAIVERLRKAIEDRDPLAFSREHFKLTNLCRRFIFRGDKAMLKKYYPDIASLLMWFYRTGKADWPDVDRMMGGVEALLMLMENFLETRTLQETLAEVRKSGNDTSILIALADGNDGIMSSRLADRLDMKQNSLTNRLPVLEKMGLIIRTRLGKNSIIYLTPKGHRVAHDLQTKETAGKPSSVTGSASSTNDTFTNPRGEIQASNEITSFWN